MLVGGVVVQQVHICTWTHLEFPLNKPTAIVRTLVPTRYIHPFPTPRRTREGMERRIPCVNSLVYLEGDPVEPVENGWIR